MDRDRDPTGRPLSARPRDAAGRPLPRGAVGAAAWDGVVPDRSDAPAAAQRLIEAGRPFAAHELLEAMWKRAARPEERSLWQGLAQFAVALTHLQRDNRTGAAALFRRSAANLRPCPAGQLPGVDPVALADRADRLARLVDEGATPEAAELSVLTGSGGG